jgi:transposase
LTRLSLDVSCLILTAFCLNKTDVNDAFGIAQVVRSGWYRPVAIKSLQSCRIRALLSARSELVAIRTTLYNQIRGLLKTFGVVLAAGKGGTFERAVLTRCPADPLIRSAIDALLEAWRVAGERRQRLDSQLLRLARTHEACQRMITIPGVGAITALTFTTAIDDPNRFSRSTDVGAFLGLTPRRYQSGEVDISGRISKSGDRMARSLLFEAANALMTRVRKDCALPLGAAIDGSDRVAKGEGRRGAQTRHHPAPYLVGWHGVRSCAG